MIDPQQELFTAIRKECKAIGDTYDTALPPENTEYPFIYIAQMRENEDTGYKAESLSDVYIDIHVWHNDPRKRGTVSTIMAKIKNACFKLRSTAHFGWSYRGAESRILPDTSTKTPLLHGIITVHFKNLGGRKNV